MSYSIIISLTVPADSDVIHWIEYQLFFILCKHYHGYSLCWCCLKHYVESYVPVFSQVSCIFILSLVSSEVKPVESKLFGDLLNKKGSLDLQQRYMVYACMANLWRNDPYFTRFNHKRRYKVTQRSRQAYGANHTYI